MSSLQKFTDRKSRRKALDATRPKVHLTKPPAPRALAADREKPNQQQDAAAAESARQAARRFP